MDDDLPPPPAYTEHDPNLTSPHRQQTDSSLSATSHQGSVGSLPPTATEYDGDDTPPAFEADLDTSPTISGAPYFELRPFTQTTPPVIFSHRMPIKKNSSPENVRFPEPAREMLNRDVNKHDWSTFLNHVFPIHSFERNVDLDSKKLGSDEKKSPRRLSKARNSGPSSSSTKPENAESATRQRIQINAVIKEWNAGFFRPRGVLIVPNFTSPLRNDSVDLDTRGSSGGTPLMDCIEKNDLALAQQFLLKGAHPDIGNYGGKGPVLQAVHKGTLPMLKLLLDAGAKVDNHPLGCPTPLYEAASKGDLQMTEILLTYGADVNAAPISTANAFHDAAVRSDIPMMRLLLRYGANLDDKMAGCETALGQAVQRGDSAVAQLLLDSGADVNRKPMGGPTPVCRAVEQRNMKMLLALIAHGANLDATPTGVSTPLGQAVERGDFTIAELLINSGASVDEKPMAHKTPMYTAATRGDTHLMSLLLEHGAKPNAAPMGCPTALCEAVNAGNAEVVKILLQYGADPNAKSWGGEGAFYAAVAKGNKDILDMFLKNTPTKSRETVERMRRMAEDRGDKMALSLLSDDKLFR